MSDILPRDRRVLWHPYTQHGVEDDPLPVVAARAAMLVLDICGNLFPVVDLS